ncbi:restriction endonuclease subunit S [Vibrio vulnificus]|nr:restriction endonuclease subunit S [Vibrio vulnificus]
MPKYESYKDSGIDWIGLVPSSWELEKGKWLFKKEERSVNGNDEIVTCFRDGTVTLRKNRRTEGFTNALKEHGYQGIRKGDLVIHAMDAFAGAIGVSDSDGKSTPVYAACTPRKVGQVNPYFYAYYMRDLALSGFIVSLAKGIRERSTDFRFNDFSRLTLPLPSHEEQTLIVAFLDNKIAQIDEAIAIKEKQISLLKERKQIIIQQAVTQGRDPNVPLKDSGVDWIGKIPAHWEVVKLKLLTDKIVDGAHFTPTYVDKGVPFLRVTDLSNMKDGVINWEAVRYIPEKEHKELIKRAKADKGDVLLSKNGTIGLTKVIDWDIEFSFFVSLCLIKLKSQLNPNYFTSFFNSPIVDKQISFGSSRTSVTNLHLEKIKELLIILPPLNEQDEVMNFINQIDAKYDPAIYVQVQQIEKLKEYKTTLLNSAVTGKIKITPEMVEG